MTKVDQIEWHDVLINPPMGPPEDVVEAALFKAYAKELFIRDLFPQVISTFLGTLKMSEN